jgi:hypothetical protein
VGVQRRCHLPCPGVEIAADNGQELWLGVVNDVFEEGGGLGFSDVTSLQGCCRW